MLHSSSWHGTEQHKKIHNCLCDILRNEGAKESVWIQMQFLNVTTFFKKMEIDNFFKKTDQAEGRPSLIFIILLKKKIIELIADVCNWFPDNELVDIVKAKQNGWWILFPNRARLIPMLCYFIYSRVKDSLKTKRIITNKKRKRNLTDNYLWHFTRINATKIAYIPHYTPDYFQFRGFSKSFDYFYHHFLQRLSTPVGKRQE